LLVVDAMLNNDNNTKNKLSEQLFKN